MFLSEGFHVLVHVPPVAGNKLWGRTWMWRQHSGSASKNTGLSSTCSTNSTKLSSGLHIHLMTQACPSVTRKHTIETIEKNTDVVLGRTAAPPVVLSEVEHRTGPYPVEAHARHYFKSSRCKLTSSPWQSPAGGC